MNWREVGSAMGDVLWSCWWNLLLRLGCGTLISANYIAPNTFNDV